MTVKELKEKLNKYPDNMDVFVAERKTEFSFGLVNSTREEVIDFKEEPNSETLSSMAVVVIDEE